MGIINGKHGGILYIKAISSILPFTRVRDKIIRPEEQFIYIWKKPDFIFIPDDPITIDVIDEQFETADKVFLKVGFQIIVEPDISASIEDLRLCIPAFECGYPADYLSYRMRPILAYLRQYPLRSILDNKNEKIEHEDFNDNIMKERKLTEVGKLTEVIEHRVARIMRDYNFIVARESCIIQHEPLPSREKLDPSNPYHQKILEYLMEYQEREINLIKTAQEYTSKIYKDNSIIKGKLEKQSNYEKSDRILYVQNSDRKLKVFLCHSSNDKSKVLELYNSLNNENISPWLDEKALLPGQDWHMEISKAIKESDIVLVCLSRNSINKVGYIQREIKIALDIADEQPEGTIFLIPVKLEECDIPARLRRWQWVNLFEENGFERLMLALKACAINPNPA